MTGPCFADGVSIVTDELQVQIVSVLSGIERRLARLETKLDEIREQPGSKEWYTTSELAKLLNKSQFTIQERWCNEGRIECEKDEETGKWRIPGDEVRRLLAGGTMQPKRRS